MLKKTWLAIVLAVAATGLAQNASIHGHAQDPLGISIPNANILLTSAQDIKYTFHTDTNGDYKGADIVPGTYTVMLQNATAVANSKEGKPAAGTIPNVVDLQKDIKFAAGVDSQVDFDLSRADYVSKLTPEQRKALDEAKAKNASIQKENSQIKNLNALIAQARDARKAGNFDQAITLDQQAVTARPTEGLIWYELGDSQLGAKKYDDAVTSYKKALDLLQAEKTPKAEVIAAADNNLGEAYAKSGHADLASPIYEAAAKEEPTNAAMYYGNEAVILYKAGQGDAAGAAADKAIAADPTKPTPYYIKGWSLVQKATVDPKTQKIVLPAGCADAYRKFLDLSPTGPLSDDARNILNSAGEKINSSYHKH